MQKMSNKFSSRSLGLSQSSTDLVSHRPDPSSPPLLHRLSIQSTWLQSSTLYLLLRIQTHARSNKSPSGKLYSARLSHRSASHPHRQSSPISPPYFTATQARASLSCRNAPRRTDALSFRSVQACLILHQLRRSSL